MTGCSRCGSAAINPFSHGRDPAKDLHLCDVCYWRERAEKGREEDNEEIDRLTDQRDTAVHDLDCCEGALSNEQDRADYLEREVAELKAQVERLETELDSARSDADEAQTDLDFANDKIEDLKAEIKDLQTEIIWPP